MFCKCSSLTKLNLSNFNTNHLTNTKYMFGNCTSLTELNLFNFNTNNDIDMQGMFYGCTKQFQNKIKNQYKNIKEEAFWVINFNNY